MKKIGKIIARILILIGFIGFIGAILVGTSLIKYDNELPIGDIQGLVVDNVGNIYVGLGMYEEVQVYNKNGKFLRHWGVGYGGGFKIDLNENDDILIVSGKGNCELVYDYFGKLISENTIKNTYFHDKIDKDVFWTEENERYEVEGFFFPQIIRAYPKHKNIIKQGVLLSIMKTPFPSVVFVFLGMGLLFFLDRKKIGETNINEKPM